MTSLLSHAFNRNDIALTRLHATLHALGEMWGIHPHVVCECDDPECWMRDTVRFPVAVQLDALVAYGDAATINGTGTDGHDAARQLRGELFAFARHFGLIDQDDAELLLDSGRPTLDLLNHIRTTWRARIGAPVLPPEASDMQTARTVAARNGMLVLIMAQRIAALPFAELEAAAHRGLEVRERVWGREATHSARQTITRWYEQSPRSAEITALNETMLLVVRDSPWDTATAQQVMKTVEACAHALLAFGIADEIFTRALYEPLESLAPLSELRTTLLLEEPVAEATAAPA
jgi:hypothetical protein